MSGPTKRLRPFWSYYGSKWKLAPKYPAPAHGLIVEPFAGSACYSLLHCDLQVLLVDCFEPIVQTWQYLIRASEAEILALPDLEPGQTAEDLPICEEARLLVRWWCNRAQSTPARRPSTWMANYPEKHWSQPMRERIASQVHRIRHWEVRHGDYRDIEDLQATWFVDPPYDGAGRYYRGRHDLDFGALGEWCRSRRGQVVACENEGATWLPFQPLAVIDTMGRAGAGRKVSREAVWTNEEPQQLRLWA